MAKKKAADNEADVERARRSLARALRGALPSGSFAERERAALELANEAMRRVLEDEVRSTPVSVVQCVENAERRKGGKP